MENAGYRLRIARLRSGLTYRDVARASEAIASAKRKPDYTLPISRLSEIENHGAQPTIFRIYTLAAIYQLSFREVLGWFGVNLAALVKDQEEFQPKSAASLTRLISGVDDEEDDLAKRQPSAPIRSGPAVHSPESNRTDLIGNWVQAPLPLLQRFHSKGYRYGHVGLRDAMMYPLIPPGSVVQIDMRRCRVEERSWRNEFERPVYFVAHRDGYACCWCSLDGKMLILQPHPLSPCAPLVFQCPQQAEVFGQVVGVTKSLLPADKS